MKRLFSLLAALLLAAGITCLPAAQASADLMNENGILRYYDYYGRQAVRIGVDVSFYNNQVDWEALKMQGIDFAIIRLGGRGWGTGQIYDDRQTQWNLIAAHDAGLDVGAYFYSTAVNATEAVEEAEASLMKLNGMALQLPLFIDMETSGDYPNGRSDTLTAGRRAEIADAFCRTVKAAGYQAGIYAGQGFFKYDLDTETMDYLPIWLASYTVENLLPDYDRRYDLWQYTDSGYVGGIDGPVDMTAVFQ